MGYDSRRHHRRSLRLRGYDYTRAGAYFLTVCAQDRECLFGQVVEGEMRLSEAGWMVQAVWDELPDHYPGVDVDEFVVMPNHVHGIIVLTGDNVGATPRGCPDRAAAGARGGQARGPAPTDAVDDVTNVVGATPRGCPDRAAAGARGGQARGPAPTDAVDGVTNVVGATPCGCPDDAVVHAVDGQARGPGDGQARGPGDGQARGPGDGQARGPAPTDAVDGMGLSLPDVVHRLKSFTTAQYRHGVKNNGWTPFPGRLWQRNYYEHIIRNSTELNRIRQYIAENPAKWALDRENPARGQGGLS